MMNANIVDLYWLVFVKMQNLDRFDGIGDDVGDVGHIEVLVCHACVSGGAFLGVLAKYFSPSSVNLSPQ